MADIRRRFASGTTGTAESRRPGRQLLPAFPPALKSRDRRLPLQTGHPRHRDMPIGSEQNTYWSSVKSDALSGKEELSAAKSPAARSPTAITRRPGGAPPFA